MAEPGGSRVGRPRDAALFRRFARRGRFVVLSKRTPILARLVYLLVDNFSRVRRLPPAPRCAVLSFRLGAARLLHFPENRPRRGSGCPLLPTKRVWHMPQPRLPQSTIPRSARASDRVKPQRNPLHPHRVGLAGLPNRASANRWAPLGNQMAGFHPEPCRISNRRQRRCRSARHSSDNSTSVSPEQPTRTRNVRTKYRCLFSVALVPEDVGHRGGTGTSPCAVIGQGSRRAAFIRMSPFYFALGGLAIGAESLGHTGWQAARGTQQRRRGRRGSRAVVTTQRLNRNAGLLINAQTRSCAPIIRFWPAQRVYEPRP